MQLLDTDTQTLILRYVRMSLDLYGQYRENITTVLRKLFGPNPPVSKPRGSCAQDNVCVWGISAAGTVISKGKGSLHGDQMTEQSRKGNRRNAAEC